MSDPLAEVIRIEGGRVLATLIRLTGDIDQAEDALQEAALAALSRWSRDGIPANPAAWLTTAGRNKALDRLRREAKRTHKEAEAIRLLVGDPPPADNGDDLLRLLFTCCHPALSPESQVALALRTLGGLTTAEIAGAFLVSEPTMGQRISRAKKKIATARIPYRVPEDHELPDRLPAVLATIYLVFTAGHHSYAGAFDQRVDLAEEAIRLARLLVELMPDEPEVLGLLALLLATHARRRARLGREGELVLMADQDRSRWDRTGIDEAAGLVDAALRRRRPGAYQIQAAIACLHGVAATFAATDWVQIAQLYRMLEDRAPGAVVRVNRAVAEAEAYGPEHGLELLSDVEGVERWHLFWSTRAELLRRIDRIEEAATCYRTALSCDMNDSDRRLLEGRLAGLRA